MKYCTSFITTVLIMFYISTMPVMPQSSSDGQYWKEMKRNKFFVSYYDLEMLVAAKGEVFDLAVKTGYNSEQTMPGLDRGYFTEVIVYTISLKDVKYLIKKATYLDGNGVILKNFDYFTGDNPDPSRMLPITKGSPVYDLIVLHRIIHGKN